MIGSSEIIYEKKLKSRKTETKNNEIKIQTGKNKDKQIKFSKCKNYKSYMNVNNENYVYDLKANKFIDELCKQKKVFKTLDEFNKNVI